MSFPKIPFQEMPRTNGNRVKLWGQSRRIDTAPAVAACPLRSKSGQVGRHRAKSACVISGLTHRNNERCYSITSSAAASSVGGASRPSALQY